MNPLKCAFGVFAGDFLGFLVHKKGIEVDKNKAKVVLDPPMNLNQLQSLMGKINFLQRFIPNVSTKTKIFALLLKLKKEERF